MISTEGTALEVLEAKARWHVGHGDCLELLKALPENSVDAVVTDPPAGIEFMGKEWDSAKKDSDHLVVELRALLARRFTPHDERAVERESFVWWLTERLMELRRVLKPGAHGLVWSLPRTSHWTVTAIESAGFEICDEVVHLFSQGTSKGKSARRMLAMARCELFGRHHEGSLPPEDEREPGDHICACASPETEWDGHGTALSPAHENWTLFRKPLEGTIAENLEKWGTGVIDIDGSRIPTHTDDAGRYPKNVVLTHAPGCRKVGTAFVHANPSWDTPNRDTAPSLFTGERVSKVRHVSREGQPSAERRYTGRGSASLAKKPGIRRDELEEVDVWDCEEGCVVLALEEQNGETRSGILRAGSVRHRPHGGVYNEQRPDAVREDTYGDTGPVTRFFHQLECEEEFFPVRYQAKPTRAEKDEGLTYFRESGTSGAKNPHPTTKGKKYMRFAVRLVTPKNGVVLDLFSGSGTTGAAAMEEQRRFIGFELLDTDADPNVSVARARTYHAAGSGELVPRESLQPERSLGALAALCK